MAESLVPSQGDPKEDFGTLSGSWKETWVLFLSLFDFYLEAHLWKPSIPSQDFSAQVCYNILLFLCRTNGNGGIEGTETQSVLLLLGFTNKQQRSKCHF